MKDKNWVLSDSGEEVPSGAAAEDVVRSHLETGGRCVWFRHPADRSLSITTNGQRAMLILWGREGYDEGVMAVDPAAGDGSQAGYIIENGQEDEYPVADTVLIEAAIRAVGYIVDHGEPDPALEWQSW